MDWGGLHAATLDTSSKNDLANVRAAVKKQLMVVTTAVSTIDQSLETVEIKLSLKGSEFALAKVSVGEKKEWSVTLVGVAS